MYNRILDRYWLPVLICHVSGTRSRGCSIAGIQFELDTCNWIPTSFACQLCALMASFELFPTVFQIYEKRYRHFCSKEVLKRHFQF